MANGNSWDREGISLLCSINTWAYYSTGLRESEDTGLSLLNQHKNCVIHIYLFVFDVALLCGSQQDLLGLRARDVAQYFTALVALPEDLGSIAINHVVAHNHS